MSAVSTDSKDQYPNSDRPRGITDSDPMNFTDSNSFWLFSVPRRCLTVELEETEESEEESEEEETEEEEEEGNRASGMMLEVYTYTDPGSRESEGLR